MEENTAVEQFEASLIAPELLASLPSGIALRPLSSNDYDKGFLETLGQLTTVGEVSKEAYLKRFNWLKSRNDEYFCIVLEDLSNGRIVGSGTVFIERKFIHGCSSAGHIEDIVTHDSMRGKGLGKVLILTLTDLAKKGGAYKVLLSCAEKNVGFYEKCGLCPKSVSMAKYLDEDH